MVNNPYEIRFISCNWKEIHDVVAQYYIENKITVDSFWEDHVLESKHYKMLYKEEMMGYFSVHNGSTLMLFQVFPHYANLAQELFQRVKKYESITNAMVATGDEFFLSHAIDGFTRIEKQAYFSIYTDKAIPEEKLKSITLRLGGVDRDEEVFKLSGDFLDEGIQNIKKGSETLKLYIAELNNQVVGFGVVEYGRVLQNIASIGMFVREEYRQQGIAASILYNLKQLVAQQGKEVRSGCWYYNHNSKKSMERAGAYSKTRLIRFYF